MNPLREAHHYLFDLDGCIWFGNELAPAADDVVATLRRQGRGVYFLSNISGATSAALAHKLTRLGIEADPGDVLVPLRVIHRHPILAERKPALVIGTSAVGEALRQAGIPIVDDPETAAVVVVGRDAQMTYAQLAKASWALDRGARLLALNLDRRVPDGHGRYVPGNGAIVAALTAATGAVPELVGKPSGFYFLAALELFGIEAANSVMVGDSLDSDIAGGAKAGLKTILIGNGTGGEVTSIEPDLRVEDLREFSRLLSG